MLRIDRMTDYAAVVLAELRRSGEPASASVLAGRTGLSCHTVARVLKVLAGAGFVSSARGRGGGYSPVPCQVSLLQVVEAVEGRLSLTGCMDGAPAAEACPCGGRWGAVTAAVREVLDGHSVDVLAAAPAGPTERIQA